MSKLFISCGNLQAGGAERVISILTIPFAEHFDNVSILMWVSAPVFYQIDKRVNLVDIEKECGSSNLFVKMIWFRNYIKRENPDLLLSFLYPWSIKVLFTLLFCNIKIIVAERQDPRVVYGGWLIKIVRNLLYKKACGILVQTNENISYYPKALQNKISVIYNPIMIKRDLVGKALTICKEKNVVTVGRLSEEKNHIFLIDSFCEFYKTHPNYRLLIFGDGLLRKDLEYIVRKRCMEDIIIFKGNTKDVFNSIQAASVFVLPSKYEGMPNALIEAMCLGLPCVSTKVSGSTELIKDKINGMLVDIDNISQMVIALNEIVDNEDFAKQLAINAIRVYDVTNIDTIYKQWINYLDSKMLK